MTEIEALWGLVTAPFPLFMIVLTAAAVAYVNHHEKR